MADNEDAAPAGPAYVFSNDLMGIKPPTFDWEATNLPHSFKSFKRYCELILSTPTYSRL